MPMATPRRIPRAISHFHDRAQADGQEQRDRDEQQDAARLQQRLHEEPGGQDTEGAEEAEHER